MVDKTRGSDVVKVLCGSRLYGTEQANSDYDIKTVILPPAQDIILGNKHGTKNSSTAVVDSEIFQLKRFCELALESQSVALEMLFAPSNMYLSVSDFNVAIWEELVSMRHMFLSKNIRPLLGYCKSQAFKYGERAKRYSIAKKTHSAIMSSRGTLNTPISSIIKDVLDCVNEPDYVKIVVPEGQIIPQKHLEICSKRISFNVNKGYALAFLSNIINSFGDRVKDIPDGTDWKAMSHAVRVGEQTIELLETGFLTFPRPNHKYLSKIRLGFLRLEEISCYIETLLKEIEAALERTHLPDNPDYYSVYHWLELVYLKHISEAYGLVGDTNELSHIMVKEY